MSKQRAIVYFAWIGDEAIDDATASARIAYMDKQLAWLEALVRATGDDGPIVAYVAPRRHDAAIHDAVAARGGTIDPASVAAERRNRFEYPGFRALHALAAASDPARPILYCHSKGIVQLAAQKMGLFRLHTEVALTADLSAFEADPGLTRAGLFPSRWGWCWYNVFWVKAGHMATRTVSETDDRYAFEALIGDTHDREGHRGVLPLVDHLSLAESGLACRPWYRADETGTPEMLATYYRYAALDAAAAPAVARGPSLR